MKTYKYLWMMVGTFFCLAGSSQPVQNKMTDPAAQLKQLLELPKIGPPLLKMPEIISSPKLKNATGFNIEEDIAEARLLCPLLNLKPTVQLEAERKSNEQVGLEWKTTNGFDNYAFDVERSLGDTMNFNKINFVWADEKK